MAAKAVSCFLITRFTEPNYYVRTTSSSLRGRKAHCNININTNRERKELMFLSLSCLGKRAAACGRDKSSTLHDSTPSVQVLLLGPVNFFSRGIPAASPFLSTNSVTRKREQKKKKKKERLPSVQENE